MMAEQRTGLCPPLHHAQEPVRDPRLLVDLSQNNSGHRRQGRRLEHHGITWTPAYPFTPTGKRDVLNWQPQTHRMPEQEQTSKLQSGRDNSRPRFPHTHQGALSGCRQMFHRGAGCARLRRTKHKVKKNQTQLKNKRNECTHLQVHQPDQHSTQYTATQYQYPPGLRWLIFHCWSLPALLCCPFFPVLSWKMIH